MVWRVQMHADVTTVTRVAVAQHHAHVDDQLGGGMRDAALGGENDRRDRRDEA